MSLFALSNARVLTPEGFKERHAVLVDNGRIAEVVAVDRLPPSVPSTDLGDNLLLPGFIDIQVNGGGGVLFNDEPSVEAIQVIADAHRRFGTTAFLPTLISDDLDIVRKAVAAVDQAIAGGIPGVAGIHIEGPFLNRERKGIHDATKFRRIDELGFEIVTSLKRGRTLVTLAPECTTPEMISRLHGAGVIVAAGHTNGTYRQITTAVEQGLTGFTHLFNAMSQLGSREPGAVGAALESDRTWCGIIVDGQHVSPISLKLALRCKPASRFMLVTDAMPTVGSDRKEFMLQGRAVRAMNGACYNDDGTLAGSDLNMAQAVRNAVDLLDVDLSTAGRMASGNPANFLGDAQRGFIRPGQRSDLVLLNHDLQVLQAWLG